MGCLLSLCYTSTTNFQDEYLLGDKLGAGSFSVVRRAKHRKTGKEYAIKCFSKDKLHEQDVKDIHMEVKVLRMMKHPNVLNLHGFFSDDKYYYTVVDLVEGGELFDRIVEKVCILHDIVRDWVILYWFSSRKIKLKQCYGDCMYII